MPRFKIVRDNEREQVIDAHRVVRNGDFIVFENLVAAGRWIRVLQFPADSILQVRRSVLETGGFRHYLAVRPREVSAAGRG